METEIPAQPWGKRMISPGGTAPGGTARMMSPSQRTGQGLRRPERGQLRPAAQIRPRRHRGHTLDLSTCGQSRKAVGSTLRPPGREADNAERFKTCWTKPLHWRWAMEIESEVVSSRAREAAGTGRHRMALTADEPMSTVERGATRAPFACRHTV